VRGKIGIDLLLGGLRRVDVGDNLHHADGAVGLLRRLLDGVDAQLRVWINEEAGEMRDAALAAHRLDQFLAAEIGGVASVGAKAEQRRGWFLQATRGRDDGRAVFRQFLHGAVRSNRIARKHQEGVVALAEQTLKQRILQGELPLLRHPIVGGAKLEILHRVLPRPFPRGKIRVRTSGHQRDFCRIRG